MNLKEFLNSILLALSFATLMMTFVSYVVYKMRKAPKKQSQDKPQFKKEGIYFNRFISAKLEIAPSTSDVPASAPKKLLRFSTTSAFFVILFGIIVVAMCLENSFQFVAQLGDRKAASEKYQTLRTRGLLLDRELNPTVANPQLSEFIRPSRKSALKLLISDLSKFKIALIQESGGTKFNSQNALAASVVWADFFKRHQIPFQNLNISQINSTESDFVVFPQAKSLTSQDKIEINRYLKTGRGVLFTGPVGVFEEGKATAQNSFAQELLHLQFQENHDALSIFPSIFASDRVPYWDLAPGLVVEWKPLDNSFVATTTVQGALSTSAVFESSFQGHVRSLDAEEKMPIVRSSFVQNAQSRVAWFDCDPQSANAGTESDTFNIDVAIVSGLRWLTHQPIVKVSTWQGAEAGALILSVDSEDKFEGALALQNIFHENKLPATYFVVTNLLKLNPSLAIHKAAHEEIASHTDDHTILESLSVRSQFEHISSSVRAIEEINEKEVEGFRPPEERFDGATLNASLQNNMKYFFGGQALQSYAPSEIADGKLIYYSRSSIDDFNLLRNKALQDPQQMKQLLAAETKRITAMGGAHFINFHSQVMGQEPYLDAAKLFAEELAAQMKSEDLWVTNFNDMTKWWKSRANVQLSVQEVSHGTYTLSVVNSGQQSVLNLALRSDSPVKMSSALANIVKLVPKADQTIVIISELKPLQKIELDLDVPAPVIEKIALAPAIVAVPSVGSKTRERKPATKSKDKNKSSGKAKGKSKKKKKSPHHDDD